MPCWVVLQTPFKANLRYNDGVFAFREDFLFAKYCCQRKFASEFSLNYIDSQFAVKPAIHKPLPNRVKKID